MNRHGLWFWLESLAFSHPGSKTLHGSSYYTFLEIRKWGSMSSSRVQETLPIIKGSPRSLPQRSAICGFLCLMPHLSSLPLPRRGLEMKAPSLPFQIARPLADPAPSLCLAFQVQQMGPAACAASTSQSLLGLVSSHCRCVFIPREGELYSSGSVMPLDMRCGSRPEKQFNLCKMKEVRAVAGSSRENCQHQPFGLRKWDHRILVWQWDDCL